MLTTPQRSEHLVVQSQFLYTIVGPQFLNTIVGPNFSPSWSDPNVNCLPQWQKTQLSTDMAQNQLPPDVIFKIFKFSSHRFWAWRHSHNSPLSYLGFIMTIVIVISFARERKLYPVLCTWSKSRIVQTPTKLNDKISLTKSYLYKKSFRNYITVRIQELFYIFDFGSTIFDEFTVLCCAKNNERVRER